MIRTIAFDLGGVILTIDQSQAIQRFRDLGLADAAQRLDAYTQSGIFGDLEHGLITAEQFRESLSQLVGRNLTSEECAYAWRGYAKELPQRNLDALLRLRNEGYRVVILSNTNPYMMNWVDGSDFDGRGHGLSYYADALYLSYRLKLMKPEEEIFRHVQQSEGVRPEEIFFVDDGPRNVAAAAQLGWHTMCPVNGEDWTQEIYNHLK